jgi:hypothetical protein
MAPLRRARHAPSPYNAGSRDLLLRCPQSPSRRCRWIPAIAMSSMLPWTLRIQSVITLVAPSQQNEAWQVVAARAPCAPRSQFRRGCRDRWDRKPTHRLDRRRADGDRLRATADGAQGGPGAHRRPPERALTRDALLRAYGVDVDVLPGPLGVFATPPRFI